MTAARASQPSRYLFQQSSHDTTASTPPRECSHNTCTTAFPYYTRQQRDFKRTHFRSQPKSLSKRADEPGFAWPTGHSAACAAACRRRQCRRRRHRVRATVRPGHPGRAADVRARTYRQHHLLDHCRNSRRPLRRRCGGGGFQHERLGAAADGRVAPRDWPCRQRRRVPSRRCALAAPARSVEQQHGPGIASRSCRKRVLDKHRSLYASGDCGKPGRVVAYQQQRPNRAGAA